MLFNSLDFALFLPVVFALYWLLHRHLKLQNLLIVLASYFFYGWWDYRFLALIVFSTVVDFVVGHFLFKTKHPRPRKWLLATSIAVNLGLLGFFKYYNFFLENFLAAFSFMGQEVSANSLHIILPVGISFYTFQTLSYTIDIYRKKIQPAQSIIKFAAFVSFFPQLVAGPIERASKLLPQFSKPRTFNYLQATDGLRQILWGLFKKIVVADNCAEYVNIIFSNPENFNSSALLLGAIFFAFQIYGDFSGYSDIAIGTARLFGFNLMKNFAFPYFSRDVAEFWRRWHISLSTWFRDYVYIPLGGSKGSQWKVVRNVFIIFLVSGFWHGANWTFIVWGGLNALYFVPLLLFKTNRKNLETVASKRIFPSLKELTVILFTFLLITISWVFFRAENLSHAWVYLQGLVDFSIFQKPNLPKYDLLIWLILFLIIIEWLGRKQEHALEKLLFQQSKYVRWAFYSFIIFLMGMYMQTTETPFIYFQF